MARLPLIYLPLTYSPTHLLSHSPPHLPTSSPPHLFSPLLTKVGYKGWETKGGGPATLSDMTRGGDLASPYGELASEMVSNGEPVIRIKLRGLHAECAVCTHMAAAPVGGRLVCVHLAAAAAAERSKQQQQSPNALRPPSKKSKPGGRAAAGGVLPPGWAVDERVRTTNGQTYKLYRPPEGVDAPMAVRSVTDAWRYHNASEAEADADAGAGGVKRRRCGQAVSQGEPDQSPGATVQVRVTWACCDLCKKWRRLGVGQLQVAGLWTCSMLGPGLDCSLPQEPLSEEEQEEDVQFSVGRAGVERKEGRGEGRDPMVLVKVEAESDSEGDHELDRGGEHGKDQEPGTEQLPEHGPERVLSRGCGTEPSRDMPSLAAASVHDSVGEAAEASLHKPAHELVGASIHEAGGEVAQDAPLPGVPLHGGAEERRRHPRESEPVHGGGAEERRLFQREMAPRRQRLQAQGGGAQQMHRRESEPEQGGGAEDAPMIAFLEGRLQRREVELAQRQERLQAQEVELTHAQERLQVHQVELAQRQEQLQAQEGELTSLRAFSRRVQSMLCRRKLQGHKRVLEQTNMARDRAYNVAVAPQTPAPCACAATPRTAAIGTAGAHAAQGAGVGAGASDGFTGARTTVGQLGQTWIWHHATGGRGQRLDRSHRAALPSSTPSTMQQAPTTYPQPAACHPGQSRPVPPPTMQQAPITYPHPAFHPGQSRPVPPSTMQQAPITYPHPAAFHPGLSRPVPPPTMQQSRSAPPPSMQQAPDFSQNQNQSSGPPGHQSSQASDNSDSDSDVDIPLNAPWPRSF